MANSRKRISELPPLNVASLDTTFVLGISGSTTYKISINNLTSSLDTTFASDLVTATLSSSLDGKVSTSSFNQYTASAINGTISGSSQLTASFDQRYVVSGSITQTTWDNIANKPDGIVSQSTDLSSLNSFTQSTDNRIDILENSTSSYVSFDTGSNLLLKNDGIINHTVQKSIYIGNDAGKESSGSVSIAIGRESGKTSQGTYSLAIGQESGKTSQGNNSVAIGNGAGKINQGESSVSLGVESGNDTQGIYAIGIGKSAGLTNQGESSIAIGKDSGRISQGNYAISIGFESGKVNQSENSIIINATGVELNNTESNSFKIAPIRNLISNDGVLQYNSSTKEVTYNNNYLSTSSFNIFTQSVDGRITSLENATGSYLTSLSGAISSSSQLTSSFDTRYALSASFVSSSNVSSIQTITSASYAAITPVSGTLYIIIG